MTHLFEMSTTSRDDAIYTKAELLVEPDGTPNHPQQPDRLIDIEELKLGSGWMRATAPGGRAAFEGVVSWTPSATAGELAAEVGQSAPSPTSLRDAASPSREREQEDAEPTPSSPLRGDADRSEAGGSE
jgi:NADH-quinone oxidoreductase subunit I